MGACQCNKIDSEMDFEVIRTNQRLEKLLQDSHTKTDEGKIYIH
jgi:hypothetical protein